MTTKAADTLKLNIQKYLTNKDFKSVFLNFFEYCYEQRDFPPGEISNFRKYFKDILSNILLNYSLESSSWDKYCFSIKKIRNQGWNPTKQRIARKILSDLYNYLIQHCHIDTSGFTELKQNKEFLIWEERSAGKMAVHLYEKFGTNFPPGSSIDQLHFFPEGHIKIRNNGISSPTILNLKISNVEIKSLLVGFFLSERRQEPALRHFLYLFHQSVKEQDIETLSITDFTFEVFKEQYKFYEDANRENVANTKSRSEKYRFTIYLTRFYVYLCKFIKEKNIKHNIFEGTGYTENNITFYGGKSKGLTLRTRKLSYEETERFKQQIENTLINEKFKRVFLIFFEQVYTQHSFTENDLGSVNKYFNEIIISIFKTYSIEQVSWKQYCISMKTIRAQNWCDKGKRVARKLLSELYLFIVENIHLDSYDINELKENKELLIWEERKSSQLNAVLSEYLLDRIGTNFPLESSPQQLHLSTDKNSPIILNLNTSSEKIKSLLLNFFQNEIKSKQQNPIRLFIYLFRYSLMAVEKEPQTISDFTFGVYKKQYRFFQKMNFLNSSEQRGFSVWLTRFYVLLSKIIKEQNINHNIFKGTLYSEEILGSNTFSQYYEKGYSVIAYNSFEDVPTENRWLLISPDGYANIRKNYHYSIDFTQVRDKALREDLKHYVWKQSSMSFSTVATGIYRVIEFLNFISSYKNLNRIDSFVASEMLEQWSYYIGSKEPSHVNAFVKSCRAYLKFYKDKYNIPILLIDILKQKPIDTNGGTPMTKNDIELFSNKFQEQRKNGTIGELNYIIFNLAATTKLRSGEILALERNCVLEKSERTGVIQYYSKTTGNQMICTTLTIEKINLIEKAIHLTTDAFSKASGETSKYIFIKEDAWRKDRIIEIVYQFAATFSKIQNELEGQLNNKYRPNNLRTTFIDNVYTEGIKDGLPSQVIAEMAGNGEKTAIKYYRKTSSAQEYAEMFAGVIVSGVDVYGNILEEEEVVQLNPVEDGLGGCNQNGCVNEEGEYQCLICPHFATTTVRIPLFKKRIQNVKNDKEITLNINERNALNAKLKLYTAYYTRLLKKVGGELDDPNI
ncbi:tyrosine-type recombinase/integrase [Rossellomorea sp. LjRoot5]|uniref:tyrosine-type recombinase/integrase n=1 Tax=Rossellomorea sp. LjRoot5 TaxID=3342331 RepID=UPI003ED035C8